MRIYNRNELGALTFTPVTTAGVEFEYNEADEKTVFVVKNTASAEVTLTVTAAGIQGVKDLALTVPASSESVLTLDSMLFKARNGKVKLTGSATGTSVAVIALP